MKLTTALIGFATFSLLFGCSSPMITPEGQRVILHSQMSTAVTGCKRLGNVVAEVPIPAIGGEDDVRQQSINNLRDIAFKQYQADTVVLVNIDHIGKSFSRQKIVAQGIAYKCD
jgi:hypothetical protein